MKLRKNSWHYKLNKSIHKSWNIKDDFCGYFWQTVGSILGVTFYGTLILGMLSIFVVMWKISIPMVLLIILGNYIIDKYSDWKHDRAYRKMLEADQEKPVGFIRASYRKFKEKTCHKIDWV